MTMQATDESRDTARAMRGDPGNDPGTPESGQEAAGVVEASAADLLGAANGPQVAPVFVPALGKTVYVQVWTAKQRDQFEERWQHRQNNNSVQGFRACLVAHTACDSGGALLFQQQEERDLDNLPARIIEPIVEKAMQVNGLSEQDQEKMVGNSESEASDASPTD